MGEIKEKGIECLQSNHKLSEILVCILGIEYGKTTYDSEIRQISEKLIEYYKNEGRHRYSEVSAFVYNEIKDDDYEYVYKNLDSIYKYISNSEYKEYADKIIKLDDHIRLEEIRKNNNQSSQELIEILTEVSKKIKGLNDEYENQKQNIDGLNTQIVSIIGIFSAIVITFFGGINFINGILTCMPNVSIYRLVFSLLSVGFIMFNTIFMLLRFIAKVSDKRIHSNCSHSTLGNCVACKHKNSLECVKEKYPVVYWVNLFIIVGILLIIALYYINRLFISKEPLLVVVIVTMFILILIIIEKSSET